MNCIIVDDEEMAISILEHYVSKISELHLIQVFSNAIEAIKFLNQTTVDLIFLDIHMPDFTGFDLLRTIKNPPLIILTTSDRNLALEVFEYDNVDIVEL